MKKLFFIIAISFALPNCFFAQTKTNTETIFAKSYDYVNDFEKILSPKQIQNLNTTLKAGEAKTDYKIMIITTASIAPYNDISEYSLDLDKHLVNDLNINTSILIVISKQMRQIQVQGVNKLRNKITDKEIETIVTTFVVPELKKGDYNKGLENGVAEIIKKLG
jgi:uncharacterized protein